MSNAELKKLINAVSGDIGYCNNEIEKLKEMLSDPINAGYAKKEISKLEIILNSHKARLHKYTTQLNEENKEEKSEFTGKKYYICRRCSGNGSHCGGVCYGCNGSGKKKTKAYKEFLGEPTDNLPY